LGSAGDDFSLLEKYLPASESRQSHSLREAVRFIRERVRSTDGLRVLDLGCGSGKSSGPLRKADPTVRWIGLDIADSLEVLNRGPISLPVCTYDGVRIPVKDGCVDLVYSRQVFEHVRHPQELLSEIARIMKPDAFLIGSTSHLEPFHSRSYWNFTPYGFSVLLDDAGFDAIQVRAGIDGFCLMGRRLLAHLRLAWLFEPFFSVESPLNLAIEALRFVGVRPQKRNALKLVFCGHFVFQAKKQR